MKEVSMVSYAQPKGAYCCLKSCSARILILLLFPMLLVSLTLAVVVRSIIRETNNILLQGRVLKPEVLKAYCSTLLLFPMLLVSYAQTFSLRRILLYQPFVSLLFPKGKQSETILCSAQDCHPLHEVY